MVKRVSVGTQRYVCTTSRTKISSDNESRRRSAYVPFLRTIYTHAPTNTSSPFSAPPMVGMLQYNARWKAKELEELVGTLQDRKVGGSHFGAPSCLFFALLFLLFLF